MSGIIGKFSFDPRQPLAAGTLEHMLDALAHSRDRARALYQAPGIGLAWRAPASGRQTVVGSGGDTLRGCAFATLTNANRLRRELECAILAPRRPMARSGASSLQAA